MKQQSTISIQTLLPFDIALKIASYLEVPDLCSLGSCSRFWRELSLSECIWESLTLERWPLLGFLNHSSSSSSPDLIIKGWRETYARVLRERGWRELYVRVHKEMAGRAAALIEFVEQTSPSEPLEVAVYYKEIEDLRSMQFAFKDIEMFLFRPRLTVLLNLIGLHYCIVCLKIPARHVMDVLLNCKISERQVCVKWWKLGRLFYGFRMRDECQCRCVSLADLATDKGDDVLGILRRGAIHEVLRVEISISISTSAPWSCQSN
ncbi:hypothetical protein K2173_017593 [Erythroxylum novogranatense]|uniref:F-box domain-containing protein n=1 Tax=Erythroxylum novogranatense TaxID=1862640 RepID=A0AAV8TN66_9ROSI|nr:hypothetical protein K2173_017593 [Erythroxylum novogranatense]